MPLANPYQRYQQTATQTSNGSQLLVMSYEAIVRWLGRAEGAIEADKVQEAHEALVNAQDLLRSLNWNLNMETGGEVAQNLRNIYEYLLQELVWANVYKDRERIAMVRDMISPLLDAWRVAVVKAAREQMASANARAVLPSA